MLSTLKVNVSAKTNTKYQDKSAYKYAETASFSADTNATMVTEETKTDAPPSAQSKPASDATAAAAHPLQSASTMESLSPCPYDQLREPNSKIEAFSSSTFSPRFSR